MATQAAAGAAGASLVGGHCCSHTHLQAARAEATLVARLVSKAWQDGVRLQLRGRAADGLRQDWSKVTCNRLTVSSLMN